MKNRLTFGASMLTLLVSSIASTAKAAPIAVPVAGTCPGVSSGALDASSPTLLGRPFRDGIPSSCTVPKVSTLFTAVGSRRFKMYEYQNSGNTPACATLTLETTVGNLQHVAYTHGSFNRNSVLTGIVGDPALSTGGPGVPLALDVTIPAHDSIDVVVFAVDTNTNGTYSLTAVNCGTASAPLVITPAEPSVAPYSSVDFGASGGIGSAFVWSFEQNLSGGTIAPATGLYYAGPVAGVVDIIKVVDSGGNVAKAMVHAGETLAIKARGESVSPGGSKRFDLVGGAPPYQLSFALNASQGGSVYNGMYTAGRKGSVTDVIRVTDSGGASATASVWVTAGITVTPATMKSAPRSLLDFTATGGNGSDMVWSFVTNGSGGLIDPGTGHYRAGLSSHTVDVVKARDSLGNFANASVTIGSGMGLSPASATTSPRGSIPFASFGGTNQFAWSLVASPSGGVIDAATGVYTAGPMGGVQDEVYAADTVGNFATGLVDVGPAITLSPPSSSVVAKSAVLLTVAGGSGSNMHVALESNESGGAVDANNFVYTAGAKAGRDTIVVTDSTGSSARATVDVRVSGAAPEPNANSSESTPSGNNNNGNNNGDASDSGKGCSATGQTPHHNGNGNGVWGSSFATLAAGLVLVLGLRRRRSSN